MMHQNQAWNILLLFHLVLIFSASWSSAQNSAGQQSESSQKSDTDSRGERHHGRPDQSNDQPLPPHIQEQLKREQQLKEQMSEEDLDVLEAEESNGQPLPPHIQEQLKRKQQLRNQISGDNADSVGARKSNDQPLPPHIQEQLKREERLKEHLSMQDEAEISIDPEDDEPENFEASESEQLDDDKPLLFKDIVKERGIPMETVDKIIRDRLGANEMHTRVVYKPNQYGEVSTHDHFP